MTTLTLPAGGSTNWDESLNAVLATLDARTEGAQYIAEGELDGTPTANGNAIQAAINAANAGGGGIVLLPPREIEWTGAIDVKDGVWLEGTKGTVLKATGATARIRVGRWSTGDDTPGGLRGLLIDGDGTGDPAGLVQFQSVYAQMDDVKVINGAGTNILLDAAQNGVFKGVRSFDGAVGLEIINGAGGYNFLGMHLVDNDRNLYIHDTDSTANNAYPFGSAHLNFFGGILESYSNGTVLADIQAGATMQFWGTGFSVNDVTMSLAAQIRVNNASFAGIGTFVGFNACNFNGGTNQYPAILVQGNETITITGDTYYQQGALVVVDGAFLPYIRDSATYTTGSNAGAIVSAINGGSIANYFLPREAAHQWSLPSDRAFALIGKRSTDAGQRWRIDRDGNIYWGDGTDFTTKAELGPDTANLAVRIYNGFRTSQRLIRDRQQLLSTSAATVLTFDAALASHKEVVIFNTHGVSSSSFTNVVGDAEVTVAVYRQSAGLTMTWPTDVDWGAAGPPISSEAGWQSYTFKRHADSSVWYCTARTDVRPNPEQSNRVTTGQEVFSRGTAAAPTSMASGTLRLTYFTAYRSETISSLMTATGGTASGTPTTCKMGLYSIDASGNLTRIGITANDTTIWAAANTKYSKALTAPVAVVAGTRYVLAALFVGTTAPNLVARTVLQAVGNDNNRIMGALAGQTDIPASITAGSITVAGTQIYGELIP